MTRDGFNLYKVLELDPSVTDRTIILEQLEIRKGAWSRQRIDAPQKVKTAAQRNSQLIEKIRAVATDPTRIAAHAAEARELLEKARLDSLGRLQNIVKLRGEEFDESAIVKLIERFKSTLSEREIREAVGPPTRPKGARPTPRTTRRRLDTSLARQIADDLGNLEKKDLYAFLNLPRQSSTQTLLAEAERIYTEARKKTDPLNSARARLAGHCSAVLDKRRIEYDNTLAAEAMNDLGEDLALVAKDKTLSRAQYEKFVAEAVSRNVDRDTAQAFLDEEIDKRGWSVGGQARAVRVCGLCHTMQFETYKQKCQNCGQDLETKCPNTMCATMVPTEYAACPDCGFKTGDLAFLTKLLRDGEELEVRGELEAAKLAFERTLATWTEWPPAIDALSRVAASMARREKERVEDDRMRETRAAAARKEAEAILERAKAEAVARERKRLEDRRDQEAELEKERRARKEERRLQDEQNAERRREVEPELDAIAKLIGGRQLECARGQLKKLTAALNPSVLASLRHRTEELRSTIDLGLNDSRRMFQEARKARHAGRLDDAVVGFVAALEACEDNELARGQLMELPPDPPARLLVSERTDALELKWSAVSSAAPVTYTVMRSPHGLSGNLASGHQIASDLDGIRYLDKAVDSGKAVFYAVFSVRGGVTSTSGATSGPHLRMGEVAHLDYQRGDGCVQLGFALAAGSERVEVWRQEGRVPTRRGDGIQVTVEGNAAFDRNVRNESTYGYLVIAVFHDPSGGVLHTSGRKLVCEPVRPAHSTAFSGNTAVRALVVNKQSLKLRAILSPTAVVAFTVIALAVGWMLASYAFSAIGKLANAPVPSDSTGGGR